MGVLKNYIHAVSQLAKMELFCFSKGLSTRMRIKMRIESEFSKFEFNSNEARPHVMRIAICSVNHTCSMRIIKRIIGC